MNQTVRFCQISNLVTLEPLPRPRSAELTSKPPLRGEGGTEWVGRIVAYLRLCARRIAIAALMGWLTGALFCAGPLRAAEDRAPVTPFKPWNEVKPGKLPAFAPPRAERVALSNGMVLFLLEDHELPLLECAMTVRTGQIYEPAEKTGLAAITAEVMRSGGTAALPGDKLDESLDDLAASVSVGIGLETGSAGFSCLQEDFERVFGIFEEVLRRPAFPQAKLDLALTQARTRIAKRNDNPTAIANREFTKALYARKDGPLSPWARQAEYETLNAITRQDLVDFHRAHFHPQRFILSLTGDFNTAAMRARIEKAFLAWPAAEGKLPVLPDPSMRSGARLLFVERPHLDQTAFILGHPLELLRDIIISFDTLRNKRIFKCI